MAYLAKFSNAAMRKVDPRYGEVFLEDFMRSYVPWTQKITATGASKSECPMREATWFYWHNHLVRAVESKYGRYEPLPEATGKAVEAYFNEGNLRILRMVFYVLLACIREARHCSKTSTTRGIEINAQYPSDPRRIVSYVKGSGGGEAMKKVIDFGNLPKGVKMGELCSYLHDIFAEDGWWSGGGYGGKPWAECVYPLKMMFNGKIAPEVVMDTGFTLAHNNGPIFNKGLLYGSYDSTLTRILDVQNSGQIPQYMHEYAGANSAVAEMNKLVAAEGLTEFNAPIDWVRVRDAGAKADYSSHISKQGGLITKSAVASVPGVPLPKVETWKLYGTNEYVVVDRGGE